MVVFFGSPDFAVPALMRLISSDYRPELVVTQPDRPAGRGKSPAPTAVRKAALGQGIPVETVGSFREGDIMEHLQSLKPDFFAVAAFGLIFPQEALDIPGKGCINLHASLLPAYRGASPVNAAILNGDPISGVSTMKMEKKLDAGPVYMQRIVPVYPDETAGSLFGRLSEAGAELLLATLKGIDRENLAPVPQPKEGVSYAPLLKKSDGLIDWNLSAEQIYNHVRGMNPWPGSYSYLNGRMVKMHRIFPADMIKRNRRPGEVLEAAGSRLIICCGTGAVRVEEIQLEGKRKMDIENFLRGFEINEGDRFSGSRKGK